LAVREGTFLKEVKAKSRADHKNETSRTTSGGRGISYLGTNRRRSNRKT
jgi:hypothetical protein